MSIKGEMCYSIKLNKVPLAKKEEESYRNYHAPIVVLGEGNYYLKSRVILLQILPHFDHSGVSHL